MSRWSKGKGSSSKTQYVKLKGLCSYAQVYEPDEFRGAENWKINLHPYPDALAKIKELGIQLKPKDRAADNIDEADALHYTFKRPTERKFGKDTTLFCPPKILLQGEDLVWYEVDGKEVNTFEPDEDPERKGDPVLIGNGSVVEITIEVWHGGMGVGNRLREIDVLDLVEYERPEEVSEDEVDADDEPPFDVDEKPAPKAKPKTQQKAVKW